MQTKVTQQYSSTGGSQTIGKVTAGGNVNAIQQGGSDMKMKQISSGSGSWASDIKYINGEPHFSFSGAFIYNDHLHSDRNILKFYDEEYKCDPDDIWHVKAK